MNNKIWRCDGRDSDREVPFNPAWRPEKTESLGC